MLTGYITDMSTCKVCINLLTLHAQPIWSMYFFTVSTVQGFSLPDPKEGIISRGLRSGHSINDRTCSFPGAVITEGWNINEDNSVVGYYESEDGHRRGFIAKPSQTAVDLPVTFTYTFESIDVPGVDFLALTASSDFEDYAGYTKSADGEKDVAFTLIDGIFTTYDFPGSQNTYFYALGNNGDAAGHYEDNEGLFHGVILEDGELRQYDFPNSIETEIYGISDATGALTGNFTDASGVRRGFTGDEIVEFPGAKETFADFVSGGNLVGSYIDADGIYHAYTLIDGVFTSIDSPIPDLEYGFLHGVNDAGVYVFPI